MSPDTTGMRGVRIALAAYSAVFVLLLTVFLMTNILVLFSQALEVLSDVFVSVFLLLSIYWSRKPADELHVFGHSRAQYVAALVASTILILFMSTEVFRAAIPRLSQGSEGSPSEGAGLAVAVIVISMVVLVIPIFEIVRLKDKGPSVKAQLVQLLKDEIAYVPALAAVLLVARGYPLADPVASLIIGAVIVFGGVYLFKDNVEYLVGRAPDKDFLDKVRASALSVKGVLGVHDLKAEYMGSNKIHAGLHIEVSRGTSIEEADRISHEVENKVSEETGCEQCVIHVDPPGQR